MAESDQHQADIIREMSSAAGGLAHEIRNALSTFRMNLQLLDEDWNALEQLDHTPAGTTSAHLLDVTRRSRKRLGVLVKETRRLEFILADFLQFIQRRNLNRELRDLNELMQEVLDFFRPQAEAAGIELSFEPAANGAVALIDENLIKQVILNLLLNAQQATRAGGRIDVRNSTQSDTICIEITDTGEGLTAEALGRIFDAYYSTKKGGTGLGLTLARQIIREHGGSIAAESTPDVGTCIRVRLPTATHLPPPEGGV